MNNYINITPDAFVFPLYTLHALSAEICVDFYNFISQSRIKQYIDLFIVNNTNIATGVTPHSFRRGSAWYRCFVSKTRRFNFHFGHNGFMQ